MSKTVEIFCMLLKDMILTKHIKMKITEHGSVNVNIYS